MKIRRGLVGAVDPITAQYDAILATEPDIPLLYRLIEYRGQIVLFQDAPCTVPVEDIGDPIGGQRHPITGGILAGQTTDGARLIWGGEDVGAIGDGSNFLRMDNSDISWAALTGSGPDSVTSALRLSYGGAAQGNAVPMGASSVETSGMAQWVINRPDDGGVRFQSRGDVGTSDTDAPSVFDAEGDIATAVVVYDSGDDLRRMYVDGTLVDFATPSGDRVGLHTAPVCILGRGRDGGGVDRRYAGDMEYALFWDRPLSTDEIERLP